MRSPPCSGARSSGSGRRWSGCSTAEQLTALLGGHGAPLTSVGAELRGEVGGALALVFTEPHVQTLTSRLLGAAGQRFQTPEVALRDAANLAFSAGLDAVMRLSGVRALHSVPLVGEGPAEMIARLCLPEDAAAGCWRPSCTPRRSRALPAAPRHRRASPRSFAA